MFLSMCANSQFGFAENCRNSIPRHCVHFFDRNSGAGVNFIYRSTKIIFFRWIDNDRWIVISSSFSFFFIFIAYASFVFQYRIVGDCSDSRFAFWKHRRYCVSRSKLFNYAEFSSDSVDYSYLDHSWRYSDWSNERLSKFDRGWSDDDDDHSDLGSSNDSDRRFFD